LSRYIELYEAGAEPVAAFEEAFGLTAKELNSNVRRYLEKGRFRYLGIDTEALLIDVEYDVAELTREQAALGLAQLALRLGKKELAGQWFSVAAQGTNTRARAEAGLGDLLKFEDEFDAARPHFEMAVELAPDDPYVQLDMAEFWHTRAHHAEDATERAEFIERARDYYVAAWKLDDSMPEAYAQYGRTFLQTGEDYDKAIEMLEEAEYLLPSDLSIRTSLAEAYFQADRRDDAIRQARSVLAWTHEDSGASKRAREILAALEAE
jgi:Flp pilus assembly protein TadD